MNREKSRISVSITGSFKALPTRGFFTVFEGLSHTGWPPCKWIIIQTFSPRKEDPLGETGLIRTIHNMKTVSI